MNCYCQHSISQNVFQVPGVKSNLTCLVRQAVDWVHWIRPLSSATWALAPPNSLRYQYIKQPSLSHPFHNASQPQRGALYEEDWEESLNVCVLVRRGEADALHNLLEVPVFAHNKLAELYAPGAHKSSEFSLTLTTVDGSREDDISIIFKRNTVDYVKREHGCFRSLFETERCPAPFMYGSQFYCFHCPGTEPVISSRLKMRQDVGLDSKPVELPPASLCSYSERPVAENTDRGSEKEEKMAVMYERLRIEVRHTD